MAAIGVGIGDIYPALTQRAILDSGICQETNAEGALKSTESHCVKRTQPQDNNTRFNMSYAGQWNILTLVDRLTWSIQECTRRNH